MKFIINRDTLLNYLNILKFSVNDTNRAFPILSYIRVVANDGCIGLYSANTFSVCKAEGINADVHATGDIAINANKLYSLIKLLPSTDIEFNLVHNDRISIKCNDSIEYKIVVLQPDEFPSMVEHGNEKSTIQASVFLPMLKNTLQVQSDNIRDHLRCAYIDTVNNNLRVVATDGRRLVVNTAEFDTNIGKLKLSLEGTKLLIQMFNNADTLTVSYNNEHVVVSWAPCAETEIAVATRLLDVEYPDWESVINNTSNHNKSVICDTQQLISALKRISVLAYIKVPHATISTNKDSIKLYTNNKDVGSAEEYIPAVVNGNITISFNARYMLDALSTITSDKVVLKFFEHNSPIFVDPVDNANIKWLVMPLRS